MDRDTFIITVYCLIVEAYKTVKEKYKIRRGGFPPALTDEEVIRMEICGAYFGGGRCQVFCVNGHHYILRPFTALASVRQR